MKIKTLRKKDSSSSWASQKMEQMGILHLFILIHGVRGSGVQKNKYLCSMKSKHIFFIALLTALAFSGCTETHENPNYPNAVVNFTIYPNSAHEFELNTVGGYKYYTSDPMSTSRGIIIYRLYQDEFRAYDRLPPNYPNACCDADGNCTRLVVEFPFVVDNCNDIKYNIINGDIFSGDGVYPLSQYHTSYDGTSLRVYN